MSAVFEMLSENGLMLLGGSTAMLLAGALAAALFRSPVHRQRVCELSVLATLAWVVLALIPMPRVMWNRIDASRATSIPAIPRIVPAEIEIPPELIAKPGTAISEKSWTPVLPASPAGLHHPIELKDIWMCAYVAGAAICIAWLALGQFLLWRTVRRCGKAPRQVMEMIDSHLKTGQAAPRILIAPGLARPVTCGAFCPIILLPSSLLQNDRTTQLRQTLLHELGHIQQRDGLGALLFNVVLPLLYFHPLYWHLRRSSALARELVVDDWAARADGKEAYITQLIALARLRAGAMISPIGAIGILQRRSHFYRRMHMLLQRNQLLATRCSNAFRLAMVLIALTAVFGWAAFLGVHPAHAQSAPDPRAAEKPQREHPAPVNDPTQTTTDKAANSRTDLNDNHMDALLARRDKLRADLEIYKTQLGPDHPKVKQVQAELDDCIKEIQLRTANPKEVIDKLTERQIGMIDQSMRKLLAERAAIESEMARLRSAGLLPENVKMKELQEQLADQQKRIDSYMTEWRAMQMKLLEKGYSGVLAQGGAKADVTPLVGEARVGGVQLDLVQLGNSLVDATGTVQIALVKFQYADSIRKDGGKDEIGFETARVNFDTAKKRLTLLQGLAEIALKSAENNLDLQTQRYRQGLQTAESLTDAESKVEMLKRIIEVAR